MQNKRKIVEQHNNLVRHRNKLFRISDTGKLMMANAPQILVSDGAIRGLQFAIGLREDLQCTPSTERFKEIDYDSLC